MPDFPLMRNVDRFIISPASPCSIGTALNGMSLTIGAATWPTANKAIYVPFSVYETLTIARFFWENGSPANNNVDVGIYDANGKRLVSSGSTAQSGASATQSVDTTDLIVSPGLYYIAMAMDGTSGQTQRWSPSASYTRTLGVAEQTSAFPLPSTATFAALSSNAIPGVFASLRSFV